MKKMTRKNEKLALSRETLTTLTEGNLELAAGGSCLTCPPGTCEGDAFAFAA